MPRKVAPHPLHEPPPPPPPLPRWGALAGTAVLIALTATLTLTHLGARNPYLYLTTPTFPNGPGSGADGYVHWIEGHPTYLESWQFISQAALYAGAQEDRTTGLTDARAGYAYLLSLLALPLGYFRAAVLLNAVSWLVAALATWSLARRLLSLPPGELYAPVRRTTPVAPLARDPAGNESLAFGAALLVAAGQGFAGLAGAPMSYVAGFAWFPVLLALALRWGLPFGAARPPLWALWGWLCGAAALFYFTNVVALAALWLLALPRAPLRHLLLATAVALAVPASWELYGRAVLDLRFDSGTAADLGANVATLLRTARSAPLTLPAEAGRGTARALLGGFPLPLIALAALGVAVAPDSRRTWYLTIAVCGLAPAMVLHHLPATQRYGYLVYPAVALAAIEAIRWLTRPRTIPLLAGERRARIAGLSAVAVVVLIAAGQAAADLWGWYAFALGFGAP